MRVLPPAAGALLGSLALLFAQPAEPPKVNLVPNGGFERSFRRDNVWTGVDAAGYLAGEKEGLAVLTERGYIGGSAMPISVSVADMNGDGLLDLVTMDPLSYLRIYFNKGTAQEPKFEYGEMGDVFLSYIPPEDTVFSQGTYHARRGTRAFASDILRSGKKDLVVGAYSGEVFLVPNAGSSQAPAFKQPPDVAKTAIPTTKDAVTRWGNVFSPVTWDWNKDGKDDIILGEGSYSANNIHLLINQGTGSKPVFDENNRTVIAFGDGLEQLSPCVVDYNGDGQPDLLVSERSGRVALYLNKGATAQRGEPQPEIPFASFLTTSSGGELKFDGISVITTADLNSDGLFDLIVGKANGRIAICYNEGTKDNPKFKPPVELKAEKPTPSFAVPSAWEIDYGLLRGNYYARLSIVTAEEDEKAEPPEGKSCLRVDYMPSPNKIMPIPTSFYPGQRGWQIDAGLRAAAGHMIRNAPARYFIFRQTALPYKPGATYILTFKVKGKAQNIKGYVGWVAKAQLGDNKVTRGERGSATVQHNELWEQWAEQVSIPTNPAWTEVRKEFTIKAKDKSIQALPNVNGLVQVSFGLTPGETIYFDDFKVTPKD